MFPISSAGAPRTQPSVTASTSAQSQPTMFAADLRGVRRAEGGPEMPSGSFQSPFSPATPEISDGEIVRPYRRVTPQMFDFASAPRYRKTTGLNKSDVEFSSIGQKVVTMIDGIEETRNTAKTGDAIITGARGERYILKAEKFWDMYEQNPSEPNRYRAKNVIRAIPLNEPVELLAPWGEIQRTLPGGRIAQTVIDEGDVYLIHKAAFEQTYKPDFSNL